VTPSRGRKRSGGILDKAGKMCYYHITYRPARGIFRSI